MSYQDLPDPRPLGVRLALGRMPRWAAIGITGALFVVAVGGAVGIVIGLMAYAPVASVLSGVVAGAALLAGWHYIWAIRWTDFEKGWPRRRSPRRHRVAR